MDTVKFALNIKFDRKAQEFFSEKIKYKELINSPVDKGSSRYVYTANNWRKERKKRGIYTPKIWFQEDFLNPQNKKLFIEVSVPKFLYGHNIAIPRDSDLLPFVEKMQSFLENDIGTRKIFSKEILDAEPSLVAFSKNIDFTEICSCEQVIDTLSKFDDRFRSSCYIIKPRDGGAELYYSTKSSTFKVYSKLQELKSNAITPKEKNVIKSLSNERYKKNKVLLCELIRVELTLKRKSTIKSRLKLYNCNEVTIENIFKNEIWKELLKKEVKRIFVHPLQDFIFLSSSNSPLVEAILDKNIKRIDKRMLAKYAIEKIQSKGGVKGFKEYSFNNYKSRQTYYNHINEINKIAKQINFASLNNLTASKIHNYFLSEFALKPFGQTKLL
ncbi:MAG: hypothetical protein ACOCUF_01830 [Patescibacteria group bacterium]